MHRVGSAESNGGSVCTRKEKKLTYVLNDANDTKHCAGVNCLDVLKSSVSDQSYLFTGSRDGTLKRWAFDEDAAFWSATFESHVDWVNDVALAGDSTLVSCSSDTTVKTWDGLSDGLCTRTLCQHSDYVTCLAVAPQYGTQSNPESPNRDLDLESDTIVELTSSVPGMWCYPTSQEHCCIYRIPERLRRVKPEAYTPQLVLIGPLQHHLRSQAFDITDTKSMGYLNMEEHKKIYLAEFAQRLEDKNTIDLFRETIKAEEEKIRASYSESTSWIKSLNFVEMILLDSVFILEFFLRIISHARGSRANRTGDILVDETCLWGTIYEDLFLLENQLPYFILEKLFDPVLPRLWEKMTEEPRSHVTFRSLILCFFEGQIASDFEFKHFTDVLRCVRVETLGSEKPTKTKFNQFTEIFKWGYLKKAYSRQSTKGKNLTHMYNAKKLYSAGVEFEGVENKASIRVRFEKGCLKIPCLVVCDSTEIELRNIMALEQCHYPSETHVCNFVLFLDFLIDSKKDVDLLIEKGILNTYIGEKILVTDMVNKLCLGIWHDKSVYSDIAYEVNAYYENPINTSRAVLSRKYFSNVWTGTATVTATLLLVMTLIQTIASVIQVMQK